MNKQYHTLYLCFLLLVVTACKDPQVQAQEKMKQQQDSLNNAVKAKEESYRNKPVAALITELETVAINGKEPYNSIAFREMIQRKDAAEQLAQSIKTTEQKEYFKLMALHRLNPELYKRFNCDSTSKILTTALQQSKTFNAWGIPHLYWESSAKNIIACRQTAIPYLQKLLADKNPAPVWGSEEAKEYDTYKYRVCDYAYALIMEITTQRKGDISQNVQERDKAIEDYLATNKPG